MTIINNIFLQILLFYIASGNKTYNKFVNYKNFSNITI